MSKSKTLNDYFQPTKYELVLHIDEDRKTFKGVLAIQGRKLPPPSKRIVLHQKKIKVQKAEIIRIDKKSEQVIPIKRINHLDSFEQVRLHTADTLYPGHYVVNIEFIGIGGKTIKQLLEDQASWKKLPWRNILPSIDEDESKENAELLVSYVN